MENILCLAHTESDGTLARFSLEAVNGAKQLAEGIENNTFVVGLVGQEVQIAADSVAECGATKIFGVTGPEFEQSRYSSDAAAAEALCKITEATLVVAPATSRWSRVLSGVAHRIGGRIDTHVSGINVQDGIPSIKRWYYRKRMEATLTRNSRPWILTIDPGGIPAWQGEAKESAVELVQVELADNSCRTEVVGIQAPPTDEQTIRPDAELLFVTGAGWTKTQPDGQSHSSEAEMLILDFLHQTQASLGSSKSLVDLGAEGQAVLTFLTHMNQVGQTGSTPRHPKGLATCCHGEEPHVIGWRFINERRAVNLDPNCGWAQGKADVLYVADAFEVMSRVNELLSETAS